MTAPIENPTAALPSEQLRKAIVECYCRLQHVEVVIVEAGFSGGIPFDSILGVEMAANLEITLGVAIPEERLMRTSVYSSLASFAVMVQACVDSAQEGKQ
jgi:hypothetical protein